MFDCFFKAATIPVANSGRDVPKATKVSPIIESEIFNLKANSFDPKIKYFEPKYNNIKPKTIVKDEKSQTTENKQAAMQCSIDNQDDCEMCGS